MLTRVSSFIVNHRIAVLALMLVLTLAGAVGSRFVTINEDLTKYLPDDSRMKIGMDVMNEAFPEMETSNTIRVMVDDLSDPEKAEILAEMASIPGVESVDHDPVSEEYNRDNHTLYVIHMACGYNSPEEAAIETALQTRFSGRSILWQDDDPSAPIIPLRVYVVVAILLLAVLFTMCGSWLEPFLFLAAIGCAVLINSGTNLLLGSVSSVTNSMAAILQMGLSMDYSVILMNRYRQERQSEPDRLRAMQNAWANAFSSVASSSLTTVAGLLMLVFMSFKIGADVGLVLAKGVFISMVCVLTILPALILLCDRLLTKTAKKALHVPMGWAARFSHKMRYGLTGLFLVLFVGFYFLQTQTGIAYTLVKDDAVADVFPKRNTLVLVYENRDEPGMKELIGRLEQNKNISSVMSYGTTLGKPCTAEELAAMLGELGGSMEIKPELINLLVCQDRSGGAAGRMTPGEFLDFLSAHVVNDPTLSAFLDDEMRNQAALLEQFAHPEALQTQLTAAELAAVFAGIAPEGMDESAVKTVFMLHGAQSGKDTMSLSEFVNFILSDPLMSSFLGSATPEQTQMLSGAKTLIDAVIGNQPCSSEEMLKIFSGLTDRLDKATIEMLYLYKESMDSSDPAGTMTPEELLRCLSETLLNDPRFSALVDADMQARLAAGQAALASGKAQLVSDRYSRLIITTTYPEESDATTAFLAELDRYLSDHSEGEFHLIGNSVMAYEMQKTFDRELLSITLLTALAIFLIVALTFRSLAVPLILVLMVQCGVYITVTVTGIMSGSMYYLALLIVECILMGATIDYGILFTNYYREHRRTAGVPESLKQAYAGSMHTILTSGCVLVLITATVGRLFEDATVTAIVRTISIGSFSVILLILFVLPGVLAACDRLVTKKKDRSGDAS